MFCYFIWLLAGIGFLPNINAAAIQSVGEVPVIVTENSEEGIEGSVETEEVITDVGASTDFLDSSSIESAELYEAVDDLDLVSEEVDVDQALFEIVYKLEREEDKAVLKENDMIDQAVHDGRDMGGLVLEEESDLDFGLELESDEDVAVVGDKTSDKVAQVLREESDMGQDLEDDSELDLVLELGSDEDEVGGKESDIIAQVLKVEKDMDQALVDQNDLDQIKEDEESRIDEDESNMEQVVEENTLTAIADDFVHETDREHGHISKEDVSGASEDDEIEDVLDELEMFHEYDGDDNYLSVPFSHVKKESEEQNSWNSIDQNFMLQLENLNNMNDFVEALDLYEENEQEAQDRTDILVYDDDIDDLDADESQNGEDDDASYLDQFFNFLG